MTFLFTSFAEMFHDVRERVLNVRVWFFHFTAGPHGGRAVVLQIAG